MLWPCSLFGCLIHHSNIQCIRFSILVLLLFHSSHLIKTNSAHWRHFKELPQVIQDKVCGKETFALYDGYQFVVMDGKLSKYKVDSLEQCLKRCQNNARCRGINYDGSTCQQIEQTDGQLVRSNSKALSFNIYAEKICITDKHHKCVDRVWALEHLVGYHLTYAVHSRDDFFLRKQLKNVRSANECGQLCLDEQTFVCRSALYNSTSADCELTNMNRHTIDNTHTDRPDSSMLKNSRVKFAPTIPFSEDIHYLENKCIEEPRKFCDFRRIKNLKLKTADNSHTSVDSVSECRELCLSSRIGCKSYEYESALKVCRLSHLSELTVWHIKEPYLQQEGSVTYELSTCYNVSILCEPKAMKVQIETSKLFSGKIYAKSQPKHCVNDVSNQLSFNISLPYIDSARPQLETNPAILECNTRQSDQGHFANDIVIQHHDLVLTTKDLSLGVYCKFDLQNDSVAKIDLKIQGDILTDKLKGTAKLPELSLHVVDYMGHDIDEVAIGDMLRVQIRMSDETTYGIFVRNLVAKDNFNQTNNFTLIDNKGCPVQMKMMREMRTLNNDAKSLESYLEAFTFTGGSLLVIEAEVETCLDKCRPMQCQVATGRSDDDLEMVTSYGRRRRRSVVTDMEQAEKGDILSMTMLSKSLLIRPHASELTTSPSKWDRPPKPLMIAPKPPESRKVSNRNQHSRLSHKSSKTQSHTQYYSGALSDRKKGDFGSAYVRVSMADQGYICFEPLNLFIICALSFCIQGIVFSLLFYVIIKSKVGSCRRSPVPSSQSMSHLYPISQSYSFMH